jgi:two-component system cell cycle sensor histidine kinase/response regulator CckA
MGAPRILVVDDDPQARRSARAALEGAGYAVTEAPGGIPALDSLRAGMPALVLLDATLPDVDAATWVRRLRGLPGGAEPPVVALVGLLARPDEGALAAAGADDFLVKPLDPAAVAACVAAHLEGAADPAARPGRGLRAVVADDDPEHLALARIRLSLAGFAVETAADGEEALAKVRASRPAVVASDILMPRLDGLGLCMAIRADTDPALAATPVILFSGNYLEKADRKLVAEAGGTAFVPRSGDLRELVAKALECAGAAAVPAAPAPTQPALEEARRARVLRQLERQAALALAAARRERLLAAELGILAAVAGSLAASPDADAALRAAFVAGFDAWGLCPAALYSLAPDGRPVLRARSGYRESAVPALEGFLGRPELAARALAGRTTLLLLPTGDPRAAEDDLLEAAGARAALLVPLLAAGEPRGVLLLAGDRAGLEDPSARAFAETVALQLAQAISLGTTVAALRTGEERYRCLVENAHDALFLLDAAGEILEANRRAGDLLGRPAADLRHHRLRDFAAPDAPDTGWDCLSGLVPGAGGRTGTVTVARPDGSAVPAALSASPVRVGGRDLVLAVARDESLRRALERRLFMAQKMEAVGTLAGGIAHDFNNLLMVVNGYAEILLARAGPSGEGRREVEEILKAGQRAAALTSQLLAFSRKQVVRPRLLEPAAAIAALEEDLRRAAGTAATLEFRLAPGAGPVKIDPAQLEQVLLQLVANARDACDAVPGGPPAAVVVETREVRFDEEFVRAHEGSRPGVHVMISVADRGRGMDEETLAHAFEPFYTGPINTGPINTGKEPGRGSGLGLAMVYGIAKQNDGYVHIESRPGEGTTVRVYLPRVGPAEPVPDRATGEGGSRPRSDTILVVEDEWSVRSLLQTILQGAGYAVLEAASGEEAVRIAARALPDVDLLLTDVSMPGMTGRELALRLRGERADLRVLFMSGYSFDSVLGAEGAAPADFLPKPFTPDQLLAKVEAILAARRA